MTAEFVVKWFPLIVSVLQLAFLPLVVIALNAQIDARIERHNDNLYAHPSLNDLQKLESKIEALAKAVSLLQLAIERLTPRRKDDRVE